MFHLSPPAPFWSIGSLVVAAIFAVGCVEDHELLREDGDAAGEGSAGPDAASVDENAGVAVGRGPDAEAGAAVGSPSTDASGGSSPCPAAAPATGSSCTDAGFSSSFGGVCSYPNRQYCFCVPGDQVWWCQFYPGFDGAVGCPNQPAPSTPCFTDQPCSYGTIGCTCDRGDGALGAWRCGM